MEMFIVDCDTCVVRGAACGDCAISALLGVPDASGPPTLSADERRVLSLLAGVGMLPPLRLVHPVSGPSAAEGLSDAETNSEGIRQIRWG